MKALSVVRTVIVGLVVAVSMPLAATVSWYSSTKSSFLADKGLIETTAWDNDNAKYISVDETKMYQEMFGFGGCFNEVGWKCLMKLSASTRDSIMKLLFDTSGCNFTLCRVPMGANDYSITPYTLNENAGDYAMEKFSIERDRQYLLPYMKAATAIKPDLKIWGSPWTLPTWMKDSKTFNSGKFVSDDRTYSALAVYFAKAVKAYQAEGLNYFAVMPSNEPNWAVSMGYPVTQWQTTQFRDFIGKYLGPQFRKDDVNSEIYLGTLLNDGDGTGAGVTDKVFADSLAYSYCSGAGYQYAMPTTNVYSKYPDKRFFETETPCGTMKSFTNANEFWDYMIGNGSSMYRFIVDGGVNVYTQWNMVLDTTGNNIAKWRQFAMIMIDTVGKKVTFTPQFFQARHFNAVRPGAFRVATGGNSGMRLFAFRNLNGENVLVIQNEGGDALVAINFNGQKIKVTIPASSYNSFRIAGTPIPPASAYSKIEAENFSLQSGTLVRPNSDGGSGVTYIGNNDWTVYHNVDFGNGAVTFEARVMGAAGGSIEVHIDSCTSPVAGTCTVAASGGWTTATCPVTLPVAGKHKVYLKFKGTGTGNLFDLNWFNFTVGSVSARNALQARVAARSTRIVMCNGVATPGMLSAGVNSGAMTAVYDLRGKAVYSTRRGASLATGPVRGIYIVRQLADR